MANRTYTEARQAAIFKCSRELLRVAASVLDDVQNDVELASADTVRWAIGLASPIARQAREMENTGHELCITPMAAENANYKAHETYNKAIDAFEARVRERGAVDLDAVHARLDTERARS